MLRLIFFFFFVNGNLRRVNYRDTRRCGQGRLVDRRQPLGSPRCAEIRPLPAKTNRRQPYPPFTWMLQKITGRVGVEPRSQETPNFSPTTLPLLHWLVFLIKG
ncbi:hypothetical protein Hanom_Chr07g00585701 [Helianthus anomalus]